MTELVKIHAGNVCIRFFQSERRIFNSDRNTTRSIYALRSLLSRSNCARLENSHAGRMPAQGSIRGISDGDDDTHRIEPQTRVFEGALKVLQLLFKKINFFIAHTGINLLQRYQSIHFVTK